MKIVFPGITNPESACIVVLKGNQESGYLKPHRCQGVVVFAFSPEFRGQRQAELYRVCSRPAWSIE